MNTDAVTILAFVYLTSLVGTTLQLDCCLEDLATISLALQTLIQIFEVKKK